MPTREVREEDRPLAEDVRRLGQSLGRVIRRLAGAEAFDAVESLRVACRARRIADADAVDLSTLLARTKGLPLETQATVARAFTLFFLLINTAEQVHHVRRRRDHQSAEPQPASVSWLVAELREAGLDANAARAALSAATVRPVLTAHPTEATRRTLLLLQSRVADVLLSRPMDPSATRLMEATLDAEVELLWLTSEVRRDRPSVMDEVSNVVWYLEARLVDATSHLQTMLEHAFETTFGEPFATQVPLMAGSWVGGDRDGNPNVSPEITIAAARRAGHTMLSRYVRDTEILGERLSLSSDLTRLPAELRQRIAEYRDLLPAVWRANEHRDAEEPLRLLASFIAERLRRTAAQLAERDGGEMGTARAAYADADALLDDLALIQQALLAADATGLERALLAPLISRIRRFGFYGYRLDVREDAAVHTRTVDAIAQAVGSPALDRGALERELAGRRPLLSRHTAIDDPVRRVIAVFDAVGTIQAELGAEAAQTIVVSMAERAEDLLRVLLLGRETGLVDLAATPPRSSIDVVPLFETGAALTGAADTIRTLTESPAYARQLAARGHRQEVMLGYSDSAKDVGVLPAAWLLYRVQEELLDVSREAGLKLTLFHGRGGTVGRGGGSPVYRAFSALPSSTLAHGVKVTEQGEVVSQKLGLPSIAERSLEVMFSAVVMANQRDACAELSPTDLERFRAALDQLSADALGVFRALVHEDSALYDLMLIATPMTELSHVHFGSRPAYRDRGERKMSSIRAIPWVFGWTQARLMLPGFLGVGSALQAFIARPGGLMLLRDMAGRFPFFDDLLSKIEMVCAKADFELAELYVTELGGDPRLFARLKEEFARTVTSILAVREREALLSDQGHLQSAIQLRNPYLDVLHLLQVSLLSEKRRVGDDAPEAARLRRALGTTLNGIAQGLRNTG